MNTAVEIVQGDITRQKTQAIVNAANSSLMGGGGVDGAIHRAGGPAILEECKQIIARQGSCPTGQAVITTAGDLPAQYVIHTVGPVWHGGNHNEDQLLEMAYLNSIKSAKSSGIKSIAFPSISTGVYRFPIERAACIALNTLLQASTQDFFDLLRMVLFSADDIEIYQHQWQLLKAQKESGNS